MRRIRRFLSAAIAGALLLVTSAGAAANGGSYLEFDRTYYVPGDEGVAVAYVSVPKKHEDLFERGPFYLFAVPDGRMIREGRSIPSSAIRLGAFTIEEEGNASYQLRASFMAPQVPADHYDMALCNDPCTISGFGEPLTGAISIVATRREAELLTQNDRLRSRLYGAKREARRAERRIAGVADELDAQLAFGSAERAGMSAEIERLETLLAAARARTAASPGRTPFDPLMVGAILLVTLVAAVLSFGRRRLPVVVEMEDLQRDGDPSTGASSTGDGTPQRTGAGAGARAR